MPTIVDALVVTLGLDPSKFRAGQREVNRDLDKTREKSAKTATDIERHGQQAARFFKELRNEALALMAVFTAGMGLKSFLSNTIATTASLDRMSRNLSMSARDLAQWQLANKAAGGTVEGMTKQLQEAQNAVSKFKLGIQDEGVNSFLFYGGRVEDLRDGNTYLLARSRIISELYRKDPGKARVAATAMGVSDDAFSLLKEGPQRIGQMRDAQSALADAQARASRSAELLRQRWDTLENTLAATGVKIVTALMPTIERLVARMQTFGDWFVEHQDDIRVWVETALDKVAEFATVADQAATAVGGWQNVLIALVSIKVASVTASLIGLGAALTGVAGGLQSIALAGAGLGGFKLGQWLDEKLGINDKIDGFVQKLTGDKNQSLGGWLHDLFGKSVADYEREALARQAQQRPAGGAPSPGVPRGIRNNNPGNIRTGRFAERMGAVGADAQGFAIFPDMQTGMRASTRLLQGYMGQGRDSIRAIVSRWAPATENDTEAYIRAVSKRTGIGADAKLSADQLGAIAEAIFVHENGARGIAALNAAGASRASVPPSSTSTTEIRIGEINIQTQATDAAGISRDIERMLTNQITARQADSGLN